MPDMITEILVWVNLAEALAVVVFALVQFRKERRQGFKWEWIAFGIAGCLWFYLYISELITGPRALMGTGYIRLVVTVTLGLLIALKEMNRIPRNP